MIFFIALLWPTLLGLGSCFLKKAINKKGIVSPYQGSLFLLLLKSDLVSSFFANLSSMLILFIALVLGDNVLQPFSGVGALVSTTILLAAWYPSLRYILNKAGIYQPGFIKSYVWIWFKWVWFPLLALSCAFLLFCGMF